MSPRSRRLVAPLVVGVSTLAATAYVGLVDPNQAGHYPLCPFKALTGMDCPACGGLRAVHSLAHGDLVAAVNHNALATLVVLPAILLLWARWVLREWRGVSLPAAVPEPDVEVPPVTAGPSPLLLWSGVALMVAFTVVRNIDAVPAFAWLGSSVG